MRSGLKGLARVAHCVFGVQVSMSLRGGDANCYHGQAPSLPVAKLNQAVERFALT
jgi:hypothetical protein